MVPRDCPGIQIPHEPIRAISATTHSMESKETILLPLHPKLTTEARKAATFDEINMPLLSVPTLCDDGCVCLFTKTKAICSKGGEIVLNADRNKNDGMWEQTIEPITNTHNMGHKKPQKKQQHIPTNHKIYQQCIYTKECIRTATMAPCIPISTSTQNTNSCGQKQPTSNISWINGGGHQKAPTKIYSDHNGTPTATKTRRAIN